jgi:hypothetical protein
MNRIIEEFRRDDERTLDRLVDGELTEEDRKALLGALDDEPGAWRRCALAFLEAHSWHGHFRALREEHSQTKEAPARVTLTPTPQPRKPSRFFELCLAMAASLMMAFGVGIWVRSMWKPPGSQPFNIVKDNRMPAPYARSTVVDSHSPWQRMTLDDPTTPEPDNIQVPFQEGQKLTEDWLRQNRSALPDDVRQTLERSGHRVIQSQPQLVPFPLNDGRRLLVPVEQMEVQPGNRPAY